MQLNNKRESNIKDSRTKKRHWENGNKLNNYRGKDNNSKLARDRN